MFSLTHLFTQLRYLQHRVCRHALLLLMTGLAWPALANQTLMILGDSLSAGYQLPAERIWPQLLAERWQASNRGITVVNASISGDTAAQGLARLPALLQQHHPRWVLIELGANDGLRGAPPADTERDLSHIIRLIQQAKASPILMQIKIPPNYGKRFSDTFSALYPRLSQQHHIPLLPFYMEAVILKPEWVQPDGIHPNLAAQPFIAEWMEQHLTPLLTESYKQ